MPVLSAGFLGAVAGLTSVSDVVPNVVLVYGTHFATQAVFGGIANLEFTLAQSDVSTLNREQRQSERPGQRLL